MKRRNFIKNCTLGAAATLGGSIAAVPKVAASASANASEQTPMRRTGNPSLFPLDAPGKQWAHFEAQGYTKPVCGVVYRRDDDVPHGMPLGGVATGCIDVDTDGTFGFCTLFNSGVPTRGPMQYGFLGLSSEGRTWILSTRALAGIESAKQIHYWGHYPIVDVEYELDAPLSVGMRACADLTELHARLAEAVRDELRRAAGLEVARVTMDVEKFDVLLKGEP